MFTDQLPMKKLEILTEAQSEMVTGGVYFGANYNSISQANIGSSFAVGGDTSAVFGFGNGDAVATTAQLNNADLYNVIVSLL